MKDTNKVVEFRGCDMLCIAEVTCDDNSTDPAHGYVTGEWEPLAPVAEVSKTVETASDTKYYDNQPMIVINSEGPDTITLTTSVPGLDMHAKITGKSFDKDTGMLVEGDRDTKYYALGYRTKGTDGKFRYVVRHKGTFGIPDETSQTEDNGTTSNNQSLTFTAIKTKHRFAHGKLEDGKWKKCSVKGIVVDDRFRDVDEDKFFEKVQTPDSWIEACAAATTEDQTDSHQ